MQKRNTTEKKIKGFMKWQYQPQPVEEMTIRRRAIRVPPVRVRAVHQQRKTRAAAQVRAPIPILTRAQRAAPTRTQRAALIRAQRATLIRARTAAPIRTQRAAPLIKLPPVPAQTRAQPARIRATVLTDKLQKNSSRVCSRKGMTPCSAVGR